MRVGYSHLGSPMPGRHLLTKKTPALAAGSQIGEGFFGQLLAALFARNRWL